jgi:hypothetical protein
MTIIRRLNVSQVDGNGANDTNANEIRPYGEIGLYQGDNNKLELLMFDGVRTHVKSKVLNKGTFYGGDADSADGAGYDSIKLVPDESLRRGGSQQYIIVEPTGGEPGHVHIRAGGTIDSSTADLFLGGELNHVRVSDTSNIVTISADANDNGATRNWLFDGNGILSVPAINNESLFIQGAEIGSTTSGIGITATNGITLTTDALGAPKFWQFDTNGNLTVPGNIAKTSGNLEITAENYVIIDSTDGGQIDIGANQADGTPNSATILVGHAGNILDIAAGKLRINATTPPTNSTGAVGDVAGLVAFSSGYLYYCTADYGQVGHQVTIATAYNGATSLNTNAFQLTKTADTLQITVGDVISDSDGGATSTVVTVSSDENYTYVGTGGLAYNAVFPLTFTSTDPAYVSGGNIWKRVAWSGDTW